MKERDTDYAPSNDDRGIEKAEAFSKEPVKRFPDWTLDDIWAGLWLVFMYGFGRFVSFTKDMEENDGRKDKGV